MRILAAVILLLAAQLAPAAGPERPYLFFDLGNSVVDTKTFGFEKILYMPGAFEYLASLGKAGFHLGLITNIPESWGRTREEKLAALKSFVDTRWKDERPMLWASFDLGIIIPMSDAELKPAPVLFEQALVLARKACRHAAYLGDDRDEVEAARKVGLTGFVLGSGPAFFPSVDELLGLATDGPCLKSGD